MAETKPDLKTHSGWCMKWPVGEHNQKEHDGCPRHFQTRSCACPCGHKGERSLESRGMTLQPVMQAKPMKIKEEKEEEETE